ncbi:hypothetical protein JUJ52_19745 [Virgibacillus sp. AGTR]|uniref:hypothetical protein n=1 Tax=Virgibacillus sp. AGTR TaxID=2812055 RepID=UPI001D164796|nr:hypothetical protein [Virgibacillus sp. AGTR]MCC2252167.1 hypothetical protein [Virgibacillus sp. AGTR]
MPKPKKQSHKKKLVTADDYRKDRDYWKRRALNQQRVIDTINHHKYRIESDRNASKNALEYFRKSLREVCPHDKWTTQRTKPISKRSDSHGKHLFI